MTTKTQQFTCPMCYDTIIKQIITKGPIIRTNYLNLDESKHECVDASTGQLLENIRLPRSWLKCPQCGKEKKTVEQPTEHPTAELRISCQECNINWYISKEDIL